MKRTSKQTTKQTTKRHSNWNWQAFWQKKSFAHVLLLPLSCIFWFLSSLRKKGYQWGLLSSYRAQLPVVVVGNITVGGSGKTPLVIALGQLLAEHGIRYAVISKGYGGSYQDAMIVDSDADANVVGDEPLLIKLKCNCPVVVAQSRIEAADMVSHYFPETQIILTDDGLQHYQLQRDVEVCVVNARVGLGNGWILPAGGLRELPSRLQHIDFVVSNGRNANDTTSGAASNATSDHNSNCSNCRNSAIATPYYYVLADRGWYRLGSDERRYHDEFAYDDTKNLAISGIAHPNHFFERVQAVDIACTTRAFPDHYRFVQADLPADKTLLMTEKDWVKVKRLQHDDAWYLSVEAVLSPALIDDFMQRVKTLL